MAPWFASSSTTRIRAESTNTDLGARGQVDMERRPFAGHTFEVDEAAMVFDDFIADRKPQAGAFADLLGREKGFEDPCAVRLLDAAAGIANVNPDRVGILVVRGRYVQLPAAMHAVSRVICEIQDDLRNLV